MARSRENPYEVVEIETLEPIVPPAYALTGKEGNAMALSLVPGTTRLSLDESFLSTAKVDSGTIAGVVTVNGSTATNVQTRAEDDYSQYDFVYKGSLFDSDIDLAAIFTVTLGGGAITREALTTLIQTAGTTGTTTRLTGVAPLGRHRVGGVNTPFNWNNIDINFSFTIELDDTTNQDLFCGIVIDGISLGDDATEVERHMGFYVQDGTVYVSNADDIAQTRTDVTASFTFDAFQFLEIIFDSGTNIVYKINGTTVATHTTNLPSGTTQPVMIFYARTQEGQPKSITLKNNYVLAANFV